MKLSEFLKLEACKQIEIWNNFCNERNIQTFIEWNDEIFKDSWLDPSDYEFGVRNGLYDADAPFVMIEEDQTFTTAYNLLTLMSSNTDFCRMFEI